MLEIRHSALCAIHGPSLTCNCGVRSNPVPIATLIHCTPGQPAVIERIPLKETL